MKSKIFLLLGLIFLGLNPGWAALCVDCHTMHNSQGNQPMVFGNSTTPNPLLLRGDCLGCHAQGGNKAIAYTGGIGIPQVYHQDTKDLAGGNFWYVKQDPGKGHNIDGLTGPDPLLEMTPPGAGIANKQRNHPADVLQSYYLNGREGLVCAGRGGCHGRRPRKGSLSPEMAVRGAHHANAKGLVNNPDLVNNPVGSSYRFLVNLRGYEDSDWEYTVSSTDHNEYYGRTTPIKLGCSGGGGQGGIFVACHQGQGGEIWAPDGTISQFCATCHPNFHTLQTDSNHIGVGPNAASPWFRHPTDYALPAAGEYANYNNGTLQYNPLAPVARSVLSSSPSATVTPGQDVVMCLSCHRAHGSPYSDSLRWDYSQCLAGNPNSSCGCFVCHTNKD